MPQFVVAQIQEVAVQHDDFGHAGYAGKNRMDVQTAELARQCGLRVSRQFLVAEKNHLVIQQRLPDGGLRLSVYPVQIYIMDHRTDCRRHRSQIQYRGRHNRSFLQTE